MTGRVRLSAHLDGVPAAALTFLALVVILLLASLPLRGQSGAAWTPPRTPWGDPDLQGNYTNLWELGTPLERPDQFAGRRLEDIKGDELLRIRLAIQAQMRTDALAGDLAAAAWIWLDSHDHAKGSTAWFVVDPTDGKIPPLTPDGRARSARQAARAEAIRTNGAPADSYTDRGFHERCITRGLPGSMMPVIHDNSYRIVQGPGFVAISYEMIHETRVIPLDGRPHLPAHVRSYMGDPRGKWDGDTLVVETTNFREEPAYRGANPATLKLVERFTRIASNKVRWSVTVDDPTTWTRPWTLAMPLTLDKKEEMLEYACHEGNYGLANMLSAARAREKAAAGTSH